MAAVGIALIALLGAMLALGRATTPAEELLTGSSTTIDLDPIVSPSTSTTFDVEGFSVGDIATGERFIWLRAPGIDPLWPIEMMQHDGSVYLFGSTAPPGDPMHGGGLTVLVSSDGISWESLGQVIGDEYTVNGIDSTSRELIATGNHTRAKTPHIWISTDGTDWRMSSLPAAGQEEIPSFARPTVATRLGDRLVVLGNSQSDLLPLVVERVPKEVTLESILRYGFGISSRGRALQVYGPLGIVGYSESLEQLGIDEEMATWLLYMAGTDESLAWTSVDGSSWDLSRFIAHYIDNIWHGSDDRLLASGLGVFGPMVWESADGRTWDRLGSSTIGQVQAMWQGKLIATTQDRHLLQSSDGLEWAYLGMNELLPARLSWGMGPVAAGEAGLAVITTMHRERRQSQVPVGFEKSGHLINIDPSSGTLTVESGDDPVLTFPLWSGEPSDAVSVDFVRRQVMFLHPDSGEEVVSIDFATLDRAEEIISNGMIEEQRALLFSRDGTDWSVQDMSDELGDGTLASRIVVLEDRVILLTYPTAHSTGDSGPPDVTIRVGIIGLGDTG